MGADQRASGAPEPQLDGTGMRIAVVTARFNAQVTLRLLEGARRGLHAVGVADRDVVEAWVPGAFELALAATTFARSGAVDAVICLGCVIRGETTHYELVSGEAAAGIQRTQLDTGVPVLFGAVTTEDLEQALARSEPEGGHNLGEEAATAAVEMAMLVRAIRDGRTG